MLNQNPDPDRDSNEILTELYRELRQLAASMLAHERVGHTLTATARVHEAYLKLLGSKATGKTQLDLNVFFSREITMRNRRSMILAICLLPLTGCGSAPTIWQCNVIEESGVAVLEIEKV